MAHCAQVRGLSLSARQPFPERIRAPFFQYPMLNLSAVVLAGGESRRMGCDKARILFGGKPLWQNQIELLRKLRPAEIFISAREDPAWRPADIPFVRDQPPSRGPLSGLAAAMHAIRTGHLLLLAIDMPKMTELH